MPTESEQSVSINSWLEEEIYQQYIHNRGGIDESWKQRFDSSTAKPAEAPVEQPEPPLVTQQIAPAETAAPPEPQEVKAVAAPKQAAVAPPPLKLSPSEQLVPLKGAPLRIAENMNLSLGVPTATSQRTIPVKVIDENRRLLNQWRELHGKSKISYTHLIAWALVRAIKQMPSINHAYAEVEGQAHRLVRNEINIGLAVDVAGKDGLRSLVVPNIRNAGSMDFFQFLSAFDGIVVRSRTGKLTPDDFAGTTISLTNPGTVGTKGSVPRLMPGQGAIIATGSIDFPPEFQGVSEDLRAQLGICKVMTMTCTYDHRIIQGAESGAFLGKIQALLEGEEGFYDEIFTATGMPYQPVRWMEDRRGSALGFRDERRLDEIAKQAAVLQLINAYRVRGHLIADLNPLGVSPGYHPELDPSTYGLTIWDLEREFITGNLAYGARAKSVATLREILETLRGAYCGRLGCEYMHIQHPEEKRWLQERMEPTANNWPLDEELRRRVLLRLIEAESFENFLHTRFVGQKRFSLEGGESAMVILDELLEQSAAAGVQEMVIGMAHRGRLTVLANLLGKSMAQIFGEFEGNVDPETTQGSGDVKYHLGASGVQRTSAGFEIKVSVSPNPSHLEAVDPVVEGIVRAKQTRMNDVRRDKVLPVLVHGDSAFAGQGVVSETLNLSLLKGYATGGTVHLVINNQIGFTTTPDEARSSSYCTDVARTVQAPILHVNGDDPDACIRAIQIAFEYRQRFKKDVVVDMICYRKYGHNEGDDPSYTQPLMYRKIKGHPSVASIYTERLLRESVVGGEVVERIRKQIQQRMNEAHEEATRSGDQWELQEVTELQEADVAASCPRTAISQDAIEKIVEGITTFPESFNLHPKLRKFIQHRKDLLNGGTADWAMGEALAFGSLVLEGTPVRLSGQDSGRGTFSQRHLEYFDYESGDVYTPMQHLDPQQARFEVYDSSLSEYGVMGFEFGYSLGDPLTLTLWEAQFGDFANGAQIIIDQFISSCEAKWSQPSGLVLLLPHGYEGQGPEHSSSRLTRFLLLCAEDNMCVANVTTPAQYFHLLRRQMYGGHDRRGLRKPLVLLTPKSLLRHAKAVSPLKDFTQGGFQPVLGDPTSEPTDRVNKILFCSGKIYYELLEARQQRGATNVAIIRLEQFYPWPADEIEKMLWRYPSTADVVWVQEEPRNMGGWLFVKDRMQPMLDQTRRTLLFAGRLESASPAAGSLKRHNQEQAGVIEDAFTTGTVRRRSYRVVARRREEE
ncbi:MAG: multifunctional oxoglutarate decarboxylase/oxoglutarate dehydrogenase thiamine pyrophosphate-binding subunit/dihydrolipoyllysine-residue succinyltransferase subunit [Bryobacteraceae bacterium]|nr:multifunctional oxoglutarate decarboxylase/oxoglutarate dehydrogenase thiamine pyrophosphate-binding subunit/dihydrolipoyllysine-residue succinyltransferase subunit [Bryobacteraceae bacterium]